MRSRVTLVVCALAVVACAKANPGGDDGDDTSDPPDASIGGLPDADPNQPDAMPVPDAMPLPDAPPMVVTLSQATDNNTITALNSIACYNGATRENSYYRAFTLTEHAIAGAFDITSVSFGIEEATAETGVSQAAQVRIYTYSGTVGTGTLAPGQMTLLNAINVNINNTGGAPRVDSFPITASIPAAATFIVELFSPDGDVDENGIGTVLFIGSNANGQTKPGYIRAPESPGCAIVAPTALTSANFPGVTPSPQNMHIIVTVTGNAF